jgi:type II secretory pathway component PulM
VWWASRTSRERALLGVLAALILAVGFWYGLVAPLRRAEAEARDRHDRAVARLLAVSASTQEVAALQARTGGPSGTVLTGAVAQTALANGVALTQQTLGPAGDLAVTVASADPAAAFRWIASLQRDHDIGILSLSLNRNPDRTLRLQIRFAGGRTP